MEFTRERGLAVLDCEGPFNGYLMRDGRIVASIVEWPDGHCAIHWRGEVPSTTPYVSLSDLEKVHVVSHAGTQIQWIVPRRSLAFMHGRDNAVQDYAENSAFASIGGVGERAAPTAPAYVPEEDREEWLAGYVAACLVMWGPGWCEAPFGWGPAVTVPVPAPVDDGVAKVLPLRLVVPVK